MGRVALKTNSCALDLAFVAPNNLPRIFGLDQKRFHFILHFRERLCKFRGVDKIVQLPRIRLEIVKLKLLAKQVVFHFAFSEQRLLRAMDALLRRRRPKIRRERILQSRRDVENQLHISHANDSHRIIHGQFMEVMSREHLVPANGIRLTQNETETSAVEIGLFESDTGEIENGRREINPSHDRIVYFTFVRRLAKSLDQLLLTPRGSFQPGRRDVAECVTSPIGETGKHPTNLSVHLPIIELRHHPFLNVDSRTGKPMVPTTLAARNLGTIVPNW